MEQMGKLSYTLDTTKKARLIQEVSAIAELYLKNFSSAENSVSKSTEEILSLNFKSALISVILSHKTEELVSDIDDFLRTFQLQVEHTSLKYKATYYRLQCELGVDDSNENAKKMIEAMMLNDLIITLHPLCTSEVVKIAPLEYHARLVSFLCKD